MLAVKDGKLGRF